MGDKEATPGDPFAASPAVYFVACEGCDAHGPIGYTREEAQADWSRRPTANPTERPCTEVLACPSCGGTDLPFVLLDYRLVRCGPCNAIVRVTQLEAIIGRPGDPHDVVRYHGVLVHPLR
jgi:hypothetical protein